MEADVVTVGDAELEVRRGGRGDPLVFLHGEDGLLFSTPLLDALGASFEVFAPHLPAFGGSTRPQYVKSVRDVALVIAEYLETFPGPVPVVGTSLGGWVALELAAVVARPSVATLALVSPIGIKLGGREDRDFEDIWLADFDALPGILYGKPGSAPDLSELSDDELLYLTTCQEAVARYCWSPYMHDPALRPWLRRVQCPALVVSGSGDRFARLPDYYERLTALIGGGATHHVVAGAGHRLEEEAAADVSAVVTSFLGAARHDDATVPAGRG